MTKLGKRLRELRDDSGYSVREFAELIGKTAGYVSQIEVRGEIPTPELLCQVAQIYGIEPDELFELAQQSQLDRTKKELSAKYSTALTLYRKEKK